MPKQPLRRGTFEEFVLGRFVRKLRLSLRRRCSRGSLANTGGGTLIELILVIIFLSVAILASMNMMTSSLSGSAETELAATATALANAKMEAILADKKSKGYAFVKSSNYPDESNVNNLNGFNRYVKVTEFSTYKEVEVKVTHPDIESCVLTAIMTNY